MVQIIDETKADLTRLIEKDFGPLKQGSDFEPALLGWLHFQARKVPQRPRQVILSQEIKQKQGTYPAVQNVVRQLEIGGDVTPWLSNSVRRQQQNPVADMMFNDWQILHFHLGSAFSAPNQVARSGPLLFVFITADRAVLLDIQPHGSWTLQNLLRILLHTSPRDMERAEIKGIHDLAHHYTDEGLAELRRTGGNSAIAVDGRFFMAPGMGIVSTKHALRISRYTDRLMIMIEEVLKALGSNSLPTEITRQLTGSIGTPVKLGIRMSSGTFILYDKLRRLDIAYSPPLE